MYIYSDTTKYEEILQLTRTCRWLSGMNLVIIILYSILYFIYSKNKPILFTGVPSPAFYHPVIYAIVRF